MKGRMNILVIFEGNHIIIIRNKEEKGINWVALPIALSRYRSSRRGCIAYLIGIRSSTGIVMHSLFLIQVHHNAPSTPVESSPNPLVINPDTTFHAIPLPARQTPTPTHHHPRCRHHRSLSQGHRPGRPEDCTHMHSLLS